MAIKKNWTKAEAIDEATLFLGRAPTKEELDYIDKIPFPFDESEREYLKTFSPDFVPKKNQWVSDMNSPQKTHFKLLEWKPMCPCDVCGHTIWLECFNNMYPTGDTAEMKPDTVDPASNCRCCLAMCDRVIE